LNGIARVLRQKASPRGGFLLLTVNEEYLGDVALSAYEIWPRLVGVNG